MIVTATKIFFVAVFRNDLVENQVKKNIIVTSNKVGDRKLTFNKVQAAAFDLIQSDARFLYTLTDIHQKARNINSNYIMMCPPYIGMFPDGAEQWCKKLKLEAPAFNQREKTY